jgi:hypothetical protein
MPEDTTVLRWNAHEHEHVERSSDWFWALGIVALCAAVTSILFGDFLFALVIISGALVLALLARRPPHLAEFELSDKGIRIDDELHRYESVLAFWVEEDRGAGAQLLIDTTRWFSPNLVIPIEQIEPAAVRAYLKERVEERMMKESPAHRILEFFGL